MPHLPPYELLFEQKILGFSLDGFTQVDFYNEAWEKADGACENITILRKNDEGYSRYYDLSEKEDIGERLFTLKSRFPNLPSLPDEDTLLRVMDNDGTVLIFWDDDSIPHVVCYESSLASKFAECVDYRIGHLIHYCVAGLANGQVQFHSKELLEPFDGEWNAPPSSLNISIDSSAVAQIVSENASVNLLAAGFAHFVERVSKESVETLLGMFSARFVPPVHSLKLLGNIVAAVQDMGPEKRSILNEVLEALSLDYEFIKTSGGAHVYDGGLYFDDLKRKPESVTPLTEEQAGGVHYLKIEVLSNARRQSDFSLEGAKWGVLLMGINSFLNDPNVDDESYKELLMLHLAAGVTQLHKSLGYIFDEEKSQWILKAEPVDKTAETAQRVLFDLWPELFIDPARCDFSPPEIGRNIGD